MHWFSLALMAAVAVATRDAWIKKHLSYCGPYAMALYPFVYSMPLFVLVYLFIEKPPLDSTFWQCLLFSIPLEIVATLAYMESIRVSPLSLTIPYLALTPVFTLLTGRLMLHELPGPVGTFGVLATVVGSYVLNINPGDRRLLAPFRGMLTEKGCRLMLLVAIIYSMTSALCRKAILHSSPMFFAAVYCLLLSSSMLVILLIWRKTTLQSLTRELPKGCAAGLLFFIEVIFNSMALAFAMAAYMISVKRLSVVISVIYGGVFFRESHLLFRFAGALIMAAGAIMISVWGK
jgi:drug/metabolite transporter (DMT)-like permease